MFVPVIVASFTVTANEEAAPPPSALTPKTLTVPEVEPVGKLTIIASE